MSAVKGGGSAVWAGPYVADKPTAPTPSQATRTNTADMEMDVLVPSGTRRG